MKTLSTMVCVAPIALATALSLGCAAGPLPGEGGADEPGTSEEALTPCTNAIPDRTAERLADMPFQSLDRAELPTEIATQAWGYPTASRTVPNNFGAGRSYNEGHEGADIGGAVGDAIGAAGAGTVVYTLNSCPNDNTGRNRLCGNGWGKHVVIRHEGNVYTRYAHMSAVSVKAGDSVALGQRIGSLGISGLSDGPHLHFELGKRTASFNVCGAPQNFGKVYNPAKLPYGRAVRFPRACKVNTASMNVRSTPNGTILRVLDMGASVQATRADGAWYAVTFRLDGKDWGTPEAPAFVHSSLLICN